VARRWRGPLSDLPVVVIDLETTGLDPREDRVVEIAMLSADGTLDTLVRPKPARTFDGLHDLSPRAVGAAPAFCDIVELVWRALVGRLIVGYNVAFDIAFLEAEFRRSGDPLGPLPFICTVALAEMLGLDHERRRLSYACERYGVALVQPHVALQDAHAARELFRLYCQIAAEQEVDLELLANAHRGDACARSWGREGMGTQPASRSGRALMPRAAA
jgi:DNA polymerase III epsilon subunit-like protein